MTTFAHTRNSCVKNIKNFGAPLGKIYVGDLGYTRCTQPVVKMEDINKQGPVPTCPSLREQTPFRPLFRRVKEEPKRAVALAGYTYPYVLKTHLFLVELVFRPQISHISPKRNFLKSALQRGKVDFPYYCGKMRRKTFENETSRYLISRGTKMVRCHLFFLFYQEKHI